MPRGAKLSSAVGQAAVERRGARMANVVHHQGMTVGPRLRYAGGGDGAAGPRDILHHNRLAKILRHTLGHNARNDVGRPTGGEGHDDRHRAVREWLLCPPGRGGQCERDGGDS